MFARLLLVLAVLIAVWRVTGRELEPLSSRLILPATVTGQPNSQIVNQQTFLPKAAISAHAATAAILADGTVACAWFAGSREGAADVAVYLSLQQNGVWSPPRAIATPQQTANDTARMIRKVGNPVLAVDTAGHLHLWYVSTSLGGWSTSAINYRVSDDNGTTWSRAKRLYTAPVFNLSTLVRLPPLLLADGGFALPTYHELATKHGELLRLTRDGTVLDKNRLPLGHAALQPGFAVLPETGELLALLRDAGKGPRRVSVARFSDATGSWTARPKLPIPNPDSSVALLRLHDGGLLLACNPLVGGRYRLSLWHSRDQGATWREALVVEDSANRSDEFSYPTLLQDRSGMIHLVYTWKRQLITHRLISPAALSAGAAGS
jgi:predicted neuraminidase